jgi:hypothetical protein
MAYETFERRNVRVEETALAVDPSGRLALNAASSRALVEARVKAVRILWDKQTCRIALQAARKGDKDAYSIAFGSGSRSSTVTAKAFLRYIGWSADRRQIVPARWNAQQKMLEAELPPGLVKLQEQEQTKPEKGTGL